MTSNGLSGAYNPPAGLGRDSGPTFPKRFYVEAGVAPVDGGYAVRLDGRDARTPARSPLVLPTRALADAVATEWASIATTIDPREMPLTRLANTVIDGVSRTEMAVMAEVLRFAGSDLLAYRAEAPAELVEAQRHCWDPVLAWFEHTWDAPVSTTHGVMFVSQPPTSLARIEAVVVDLVGSGAGGPFRLGALHVMTSLTGSLLLACAVAAGRLSDQAAWTAAHVDEDHQIAVWGRDEEAELRRRTRWIDMQAAASIFALSSQA